MPSIDRTLRKQASESTEPTPEVRVSESSAGGEDRLRVAALTPTATSTHFFTGWLARCLIAVIAVALALLLRVAAAPFALPPHNTFYPFVLFAAMLGGIWAGLLTTALSALAALFWVLPSFGQFANSPTSEAISSAMFCVTGICVSIVAELYNRKRERLAAANEQLRAEIAERKQVEEVLRLSEEKFTNAFAKNQAAVSITRLRGGVFLEVNDTLLELSGYSREEMIGRSSRTMMWPTRDACARCLRKLREKGSMRNWEQDFVKKSGEVFVTELSAQIWILSGKRLVVTTLVDITERKRAEKALQDSEGRLRLALDAANSGIWEWNLRTNKSKWSTDVWRLHSLDPRSSEPSYESWLSTVHPQDREIAQQKVREAADSSTELNVEYRVVDENNGVRWLAAQGRPLLDERGVAVSYIGIVTDISSRKRAEEALLRTEKLAATGRMAATIAHEVNNPLAAAMNALYLASTDPGSNPSTKEYLTIADQELRRAAHITQQTLGFYRATSSPTPITLPKLIDDVLGVYARKLQNRDISVHRHYRCGHCAQGCEACFLVSAGEMRQIISNLLVNGMDALNDHGTLYIRASRTSSLNESGPHIHLTIADNGCGVRQEHLTRIFEPFFTTKDSGTGLGLWVTQELVRKHNGVIRVRSSKGRGTVFRITFPAMPVLGTKQDSSTAA